MPIILTALALSTSFLIGVATLAKSRFGNSGVCWLSGLATILFVFFALPASLFHSVMTLGLAIICTTGRFKPRIIVAGSTSIMILVFLLLALAPYKELQERAKLREEYPLVSISGRLHYERTLAESEGDEVAEDALSPEVQKNLNNLEDRAGNGRAWTLASVHRRTQDEFIRARGFGHVRMRHVSPSSVELPEEKPVPLPTRQEPSYDAGVEPTPPLAGFPATERSAAFMSLHRSGLEDFFDVDRIGYVKDRDHVAGFEPHRFTKMPQVRDRTWPRTEWQITRLDLVSLLKHKTPVAYVSKNLPQMDELGDAPTRPLDAFEQNALKRLQSEEDLVTDEAADRIRMVGSLRAAKDCTRCHSVRRGELLGAFSYELSPASPPPKKDAKKAGEPQASVSNQRLGTGDLLGKVGVN